MQPVDDNTFITFIRIYFIFKTECLSDNFKLILHKAPIIWVKKNLVGLERGALSLVSTNWGATW
jgi:hypothetical protein